MKNKKVNWEDKLETPGITTDISLGIVNVLKTSTLVYDTHIPP